ncbi:MAG: PQQ-binding-like beta-propeller repeat protein [Melioribacteraceae bacterium]|nr:MAG: T9SS C-terminal target domain-containing protein [Ignavibacteriales bacterium]WKZ69590.1 MAG: PQQ-binding-like beta-propeller repeat protein [Melioribacteraceae bacterium]
MIKIFMMTFMFFVINTCFSQTQEKIPWPSLADSPWPILRGDAQGTGRSEFVGPKTANVIWRKDIPLGVLYGPVIGYNDMLYVGTRAATFDSSNAFYSVTPTGELHWKYRTGHSGPTNLGPTVGYDSTVYFGSAAGYSLYALSYDGLLKWKRPITSGFQYNISISKSGKIFYAGKDTLHIINASNGVTISKHYYDGMVDHLISFSPEGDVLYVNTGIINQPNMYNYLNAIDTLGNLIWRKKFNNLPFEVPLVDNEGNIYVLGRDTLDNYSLFSFYTDGSLRWSYPVRTHFNFSAPTIDFEGNIIFYSLEYDFEIGKDISVILSLDYSGNLNWKYVIDPEFLWPDTHINHGLVCDAEGKIYFGSASGKYFYCLDKSGEPLWKFDLGGYEYDSCPAIGSDGTLYIGTHLQSLSANNQKNLIAIKDNPNSVKEEELPSEYKLEQNYPNPFNPSTTIKFSLPEKSKAKLSIYNLLGQEIEILFYGEKEAGSYEYVFDNKSISTGVYFYILETPQTKLSRKMMLIK